MRDPRRLTLAATVLGSSLAFIDATVVFVAMPTIERELDLGLAGEQWIFLGYSLALAALYLVAGATGDRFGRRPVFVSGALAFAITSMLVGAAPTEEALIAGRILQGVAAAFVTTNSLALLRSVYGDAAGRAIGLWTAFTSVATLAAPPVGGALVEWLSWRWIFYVNVPLAAAAVALALLDRGDERAELRARSLDLRGAALAATAFGSLTYGLVEGSEHGFGEVWWAFLVGAAALAAFLEAERRTDEPMLPLALFRLRNFAAVNAETFFVYGALYGVFVFLTLYLQFLGFSPFETGLILIPPSAALIALAARVGTVAERRGPRWFLAAGPALLGGAALVLPLVDERRDIWVAGAAGITLLSLSLTAFVAPITATALRAAPTRYAGVASGVNSTVSRLGSLIAVAVIGAVISLVFHSRVDAPDAVPLAKDQRPTVLRDASKDAFQIGMLVTAALAFTGAAIGAFGISNAAVQAGGDAASEPAPAGS